MRIPTPAYHKLIEEAGHRLIRNQNGQIDIFRLDAGNHNGPECELCGETWCQHCQIDIEKCKNTASAILI